MNNPCLLFAIAATSFFSQWTPDQAVSLLGKVVWPCFYLIVMAAWRSKLGKLLDALIVRIPSVSEIEVLGIKIRLVKPEEVQSGRGISIPERISALPEEPSRPRQLVKERITRWQ